MSTETQKVDVVTMAERVAYALQGYCNCPTCEALRESARVGGVA